MCVIYMLYNLPEYIFLPFIAKPRSPPVLRQQNTNRMEINLQIAKKEKKEKEKKVNMFL